MTVSRAASLYTLNPLSFHPGLPGVSWPGISDSKLIAQIPDTFAYRKACCLTLPYLKSPFAAEKGGKHNRPDLFGGEAKDPRGLTPTGKALQSQELTLLSQDGEKLFGLRKGWRALVTAKPYAPANGQDSVSSPGIMGGHQGTSTAISDLVAKLDT